MAPNEAEIRTAINTLKSRNAAGPNNIAPEVWKTGSKIIAKALVSILTTEWDSGFIPPEWKEGLIMKLQKRRQIHLQ